MKTPPMDTNQKTVILVIVFVGILAVIGLLGMFWLAHHKMEIPDSLPPIVGGLTGILGTLLTSTRSRNGKREEEQK